MIIDSQEFCRYLPFIRHYSLLLTSTNGIHIELAIALRTWNGPSHPRPSARTSQAKTPLHKALQSILIPFLTFSISFYRSRYTCDHIVIETSMCFTLYMCKDRYFSR